MNEKQQYDKKEARERFEAALRGARAAGHKPMDSLTHAKSKRQQKPKKKSKASA